MTKFLLKLFLCTAPMVGAAVSPQVREFVYNINSDVILNDSLNIKNDNGEAYETEMSEIISENPSFYEIVEENKQITGGIKNETTTNGCVVTVTPTSIKNDDLDAQYYLEEELQGVVIEIFTDCSNKDKLN